MKKIDVKEFFVSPLGRARNTASCTLEAMNRTAEVCDWLQEISVKTVLDNQELLYAYPDQDVINGVTYSNVVWDVLPGYLSTHEEYFHPTEWRNSKIAKNSNIVEVYDNVIAQFDQLLANHGYVRSGNHYKVTEANRDTLVFFCHYGLSCVLLSHLMNVSPFILWHGVMFAPTSVSSIYTEEREEGIAYFRGGHLGDISHLFAAGMEPSFAGRFCETFDSKYERH